MVVRRVAEKAERWTLLGSLKALVWNQASEYLGNRQQLDVENEGGVAGDAVDGARAVGHVGGNVDAPAVARTHTAQGYLPTVNHFVKPEHGRTLRAVGFVEHAAVD